MLVRCDQRPFGIEIQRGEIERGRGFQALRGGGVADDATIAHLDLSKSSAGSGVGQDDLPCASVAAEFDNTT